jgi:hypothetical protein
MLMGLAVPSLGLREMSQKAGFRCAGSGAGSPSWPDMPFRSSSGWCVLATAAQAVQQAGAAGIPE